VTMVDPRIAGYIRKHRQRYTPGAIRQRLVEAGYPAADVDAAFAALIQEPPQRRSVWSAVLQALLITVAVICLGALLIGGICLALVFTYSG
jgi:hypothetical protein